MFVDILVLKMIKWVEHKHEAYVEIFHDSWIQVKKIVIDAAIETPEIIHIKQWTYKCFILIHEKYKKSYDRYIFYSITPRHICNILLYEIMYFHINDTVRLFWGCKYSNHCEK